MTDQILTLKHYKEPLLAVKKKDGFGYYGAISISLDDGEKMQCHVCGKLYDHVGMHAYLSHDLRADAYRERFKLSPTTSLISEPMRQKLKAQMIRRMANMSKKERVGFMAKARAGRALRGRYQPKESLESKNKKGTCPDQLLAKIHECAKELGHTPSKKDFITYCDSQRYIHLIYKTFGSWSRALEMAKLQPKEWVQNGGPRHYSDEELLEYLVLFHQENQKIPTETDCRRGLIPDSHNYKRRFGGLPQARKLAGIREIPTRHSTVTA